MRYGISNAWNLTTRKYTKIFQYLFLSQIFYRREHRRLLGPENSSLASGVERLSLHSKHQSLRRKPLPHANITMQGRTGKDTSMIEEHRERCSTMETPWKLNLLRYCTFGRSCSRRPKSGRKQVTREVNLKSCVEEQLPASVGHRDLLELPHNLARF